MTRQVLLATDLISIVIVLDVSPRMFLLLLFLVLLRFELLRRKLLAASSPCG